MVAGLGWVKPPDGEHRCDRLLGEALRRCSPRSSQQLEVACRGGPIDAGRHLEAGCARGRQVAVDQLAGQLGDGHLRPGRDDHQEGHEDQHGPVGLEV